MSLDSPFLHDWLFWHADRQPEAAAVATPGCRLSYGELGSRVRALAAQLAAAGIGWGDRVLMALPNTAATVVGGLALNALGAISVEVNPEWSPEVLAEIVAHSRVRQAFIQGRDGRKWRRVCDSVALERIWVVHPDPLPPPLLEALGPTPVQWLEDDGRVAAVLRDVPRDPPPIRPDDPALILYTSGSTGRPRGVIQTHANVNANTRSIVEYLGLSAQDRALLVLPLYYCYGRSVLQTHLRVGGSVFLDGRFAFPRLVMTALGQEGCTGFAGVPLTFEILRRQVDLTTIDRPRLRYLTQAGGAMSPATIDWVRQAFHPARLFVMYGQTEATARLSFLPPERAQDKRGSIGVAIPGVELRVVDDEGRRLAQGEVGNLIARGANVTPGYLDEPEETALILREGWLWTGDLAYQDADGFLFHCGRSKEILKIGGHRVSPVEIENVLAEHPAVAAAAVVGVPDPLMGEVPAAFVVAVSGRPFEVEGLKAFCRERMPAYRVPVRIERVESLPRNAAGKLLRAELRARVG